MDLDSLIKILHDESLSCVILKKDGGIVKCYRRGIIDLFELLKNSPQTLDSAIIADKVVGRGAAALMALGGVAKLHTDLSVVQHLNCCNNRELLQAMMW